MLEFRMYAHHAEAMRLLDHLISNVTRMEQAVSEARVELSSGALPPKEQQQLAHSIAFVELEIEKLRAEAEDVAKNASAPLTGPPPLL